MARKSIQGITIEIGGDTTKLQTALKGVESKLKDTQASLKDVRKLLKLDPGNVELLTQKQKLLTDSIEGTEDKLKALRTAAEQANDQLARGDISQEQFDALQREIIETENELKSLKGEMKEFGSVTAQQMAAAGEKVKAVGDKITTVGTAMTKYVTGPIVAVGAASVAAFSEVDDGLDIIVKKTGATGDALADLQDRAKNLATSIPTDFQTAGTAVGEVNTRFGLVGDELEELSGKFIKFAALNNTDVSTSIDNVQAAMAAFNVPAERAGDVLDIINKAAQDTGTDVSKLTSDLTANSAALQQMGFRISAASGFLANMNKNGLDSSTVLTGMKKALANATKDGKSMTRALSDLQSSIKNAKSETEAMRIATELFGSKAAPTMVAAIQEGRISFDELANSVKSSGGSVEDTFEETLDPIDSFKTALNELKIVGMELVEAAAPLIKSLASTVRTVISEIRSRWESLSPAAQTTIVKLAAITAAVGPVVAIVGKLTSAVGSILTLAPTISSVIATVKTGLSALWAVLAANPIGLVVAAIAALVAGFVVLWNKSEAFRNFWKGLWEGIKTTVSTAVEKIRKFFSFDWELPKIKLPHFKIEGSFSIAPPRVPHLSIEWYRKAMQDGMILNSPTIFGARGNTLLGGGEAGSEAVVGVNSLRSMIRDAVSGASGGTTPTNVTVILQLKETELARTVFRLNNAETQRVGVKLST